MPPILLHLPPQTPQPGDVSNERAARMYELADLAVFHITGADALSFIQGQVTNDIASASTLQSKLAGYCTAQGRLLATLVLNQLPETSTELPTIQGLIKRDLCEPVLKRLSMFVLRAKAKLSVTSQRVVGVSVTNDQKNRLEEQLGHTLPLTPWEVTHCASGSWICAPVRQGHRWWWIVSNEQLNTQQALFNACLSQDSEEWHALDIDAGIPWIELSTQDVFIPQTLNLDLIEGVSFTKGCYPGQEIVARSHYRGTLKKRMALGQLAIQAEAVGSTDLKAGMDVYQSQHPDQPCGRIINVAKTAQGIHLLFEVTFEAMDHDVLTAGSATGPVINLMPLPYALRPA